VSKLHRFHQEETLIAQGDQEAIAYIIRTGWVQVQRCRDDHCNILATLGPGEIVGELGLMGLSPVRTASVIAITDGTMEIIDRTAMVRLANGSASDIVPLLASLFSRLQSLQYKQDEDETTHQLATSDSYATITPDNDLASRTLCGHSVAVTLLPWVFGAYRPPVTVSDLFQPDTPANIRLPTADPTITPDHLTLQTASHGQGLELVLAHPGAFLLIDEEPLPKVPATCSVALAPGKHRIVFGSQVEPYAFIIDCNR